MSAKVYFSKEITSQKVLEMYRLLEKKLDGNVAVKVHSGEHGNQNFLKPDFWKPINEGQRNTTQKHLKLLEEHEWSKYFKVDLLDAEGPDDILEIPNGKVIKKNYVGKNMKNYDSMLVLSHFKGHPMGGYGGAIKQLSIGCASSQGKAYIHGAGSLENIWGTEQNLFLEAMADAAGTVVDFFKGKIVYINVMKNLSVDCDCCEVAEDPCMKDIGILASTDPVAVDQACIDLVYAATDDPGQKHFLERVESRNGVHTIESAAEQGYGSRDYELINID